MADDSTETGFERLDRKVGMAWSRFWGMVLIGVALVIAGSVVADDQFAVSSHWPGLAFAAFLLLLARLCYRSREGMLDLMSGTQSSRARR
ncbi:MAG: hypothetical protein R3D89_12585 [Sphingomonadaceae bacterium]